MVIETSALRVMKIVNITPRVGKEPTSLVALRPSMLTRLVSLMSPPYPHLPVYVVPCLRGQCRLLLLHYLACQEILPDNTKYVNHLVASCTMWILILQLGWWMYHMGWLYHMETACTTFGMAVPRWGGCAMWGWLYHQAN